MHYLYLALAILFEVAGTISLRLCDGFTKLFPSLIVVVGYAVSFFFLSLTLKAIPVAIADSSITMRFEWIGATGPSAGAQRARGVDDERSEARLFQIMQL